MPNCTRQVQTQLEELTRLFHQVERAKQEWEHTIDAIDDGISLVDTHGRIVRANRTLADWVHLTRRPTWSAGRVTRCCTERTPRRATARMPG